ncbi:hypothetical protein [Dactylosporangium sp. CS-033363]|uniref:hypothetical protein n=1 Tax=Dactylosporangium sp. CS-033363 TaxID=3239935 RepID=UPI003D8E61F7
MNRRRALLIMAGLLAVLALCAGGAVAADLVHYATGTRGTITVRACTAAYAGRSRHYDCTGEFTSADGSVHREATFTETFAEPPGAALPATLDGDTVHEVNPAATLTGVLVAVAALAGLVFLLLRRRGENRHGDGGHGEGRPPRR